MSRSIKKFALFVLLAWLPLQSVATPALSLLCDSGALGGDSAQHLHAQPALHEHGEHHDHANPSDADSGMSGHDDPSGQPEPGGLGGLGHSCCDHHYSALPALGSVPVAVIASPRPVALAHALRPFFPEQPHHPPSL